MNSTSKKIKMRTRFAFRKTSNESFSTDPTTATSTTVTTTYMTLTDVITTILGGGK